MLSSPFWIKHQILDYYIHNPEEAKKIANAGQKKCAETHTWKMRLNSIFNSIEIKKPELLWKHEY